MCLHWYVLFVYIILEIKNRNESEINTRDSVSFINNNTLRYIFNFVRAVRLVLLLLYCYFLYYFLLLLDFFKTKVALHTFSWHLVWHFILQGLLRDNTCTWWIYLLLNSQQIRFHIEDNIDQKMDKRTTVDKTPFLMRQEKIHCQLFLCKAEVYRRRPTMEMKQNS